MTPEQQSQFEQSSAWLFDTFPGQWWRLYTNLVAQGFTEVQALDLVKTYIVSQGSGDKLPPKT